MSWASSFTTTPVFQTQAEREKFRRQGELRPMEKLPQRLSILPAGPAPVKSLSPIHLRPAAGADSQAVGVAGHRRKANAIGIVASSSDKICGKKPPD
jgi:hypothetical protein